MVVRVAGLRELDGDLSGYVIDAMSPEHLQDGILSFMMLLASCYLCASSVDGESLP